MALFGISQEEAEMAVAAAAGGGASQAGMPLEPMKVPGMGTGNMMGLESVGVGGRGGEVHYHLHVTVGSQAEGRDLARLFGELQALANI